MVQANEDNDAIRHTSDSLKHEISCSDEAKRDGGTDWSMKTRAWEHGV